MCDLPAGRRLCGHGVAAQFGLRSGFAGLLCRHLPEWHGVYGPVRDWSTSSLAIGALRSVTMAMLAFDRLTRFLATPPNRRAASEIT